MDATKVLFPSDIISMDVFPDGESIIYTQDNFVHLLNAKKVSLLPITMQTVRLCEHLPGGMFSYYD